MNPSPGATRRGRPTKFGRPARAITLTLPDDVLADLSRLDADLGRAIVKLVQRRAKRARPFRPAEVAAYGSHAVIIVSQVKALGKLPGVNLVPVGNGGYLIALKPPYTIPQLELDIRDALADGELRGTDRDTLAAVAEILRHARGTRSYPKERTIIVLENRRKNGERAGRQRMLRRNDHT